MTGPTLTFPAVCKVCGHSGRIELDLEAFRRSAEEQGLSDQEAADVFVAALESGEVECPACMAKRN
jgi:hypothetical protein